MVELRTRRTYSERALERNKVALDTVDSFVRDSGLAILEDRGDIDGFPLDRGLYSHLARCPSFVGACWDVTFAAEKMSLTDWEISGPIPSPSIKVTVYFPYWQQFARQTMIQFLPLHTFVFIEPIPRWRGVIGAVKRADTTGRGGGKKEKKKRRGIYHIHQNPSGR